MRKGQYSPGHKWVYFIIAIFLLAFMFLFLRSAFADYQVGKLQCADEVIDELMIAKVLYSPDCFAYYDKDTERTTVGMIDKAKFTHETYESCFTYIIKKVTLRIDDTTIGETIYSPKEMAKPILLYDEGAVTATTLYFTFAEPGECK
jgi:hypothetical protein